MGIDGKGERNWAPIENKRYWEEEEGSLPLDAPNLTQEGRKVYFYAGVVWVDVTMILEA